MVRLPLLAALMAALLLSTLAFDSEDGGDCNDCASHGEISTEAPTHEHGDRDDRHDGPDGPCDHGKDFHCACAHSQAMIGMTALDAPAAVAGEAVALLTQDVRIDPSARQTFHIPIA